METWLLGARQGSGTAIMVLRLKMRKEKDPAKKKKLERVVKAIEASQTAIDQLLTDPDFTE